MQRSSSSVAAARRRDRVQCTRHQRLGGGHGISAGRERQQPGRDGLALGIGVGPAARTRQPSDYERRIVIMQAYLRHDDSRILTDTPAADPTRHAIQAQLRRSACTWTVPFEVIQLSDSSWIVNSVDVAAAGNPARPCDPTTTDTSTAQ